MSGMNGTVIAASSSTAVSLGTASPVTKAGSPDSSKDPKVIAAYVCFGVGAFIIILSVIIIIVFLLYRKRRRLKQKEDLQRSSLNLDDYKFPGSSGRPISTISDSDGTHTTRIDAPDYNFTGNGYRFPLATTTTMDRNALTQRHPLDDESSLPVVLRPISSSHSTDSVSPFPSRSSGGEIGSSAESGLAETEGYVRLHRSSPLAGINAIYSSSGELNTDYESTPRRTITNSGDSRNVRVDAGIRRTSLKRDVADRRENARNLGNGSRYIGAINEGFVSDDYYDTPKVSIGGGSLRTSLDRLKRDRVAPTKSRTNRKSSVLLDNGNVQNGVYHVSLRHDGSSVTQTSVVKQPT